MVTSTQPSPLAHWKVRTKRTLDGKPAHSVQTMLEDLASVGKHRVQPNLKGIEPFDTPSGSSAYLSNASSQDLLLQTYLTEEKVVLHHAQSRFSLDLDNSRSCIQDVGSASGKSFELRSEDLS